MYMVISQVYTVGANHKVLEELPSQNMKSETITPLTGIHTTLPIHI